MSPRAGGTKTAARADEAVPDPAAEHVNQVRLVGKVSSEPAERVLPSGDVLWTFRLVVSRLGEGPASKQTVDTLDCAVWSGRVRRSVMTWKVGDLVEVGGAVRRRFYRTGAGAVASRVEVEVVSGRMLRRAATA